MSKEQLGEKIEQKEGPEIEYSFFFNTHRTERDFERLEEAFEDADIYVPELFGWTQETLDNFNEISQGNLDPELTKTPRGSPRWKEITLLYQSEKPVLFADIPEGDAFLDLRKEFDIHLDKAWDLFINGKLDAAVEEYKVYSQKILEYQTQREKKIKENLQEQIDRFLEEHPEWKNKDNIKVLVSIGIGHIPIYHDLKHEKSSTKRTFSYPLMVYSVVGEIITRLRHGKEVSDELYAKAIIDGYMMSSYLTSLSDDTQKCTKVSRKITSQLSIENIREISENCARNHSTLLEEIRNLGIHIPQSEEEMNAMFPKSKLHPYGTKKRK